MSELFFGVVVVVMVKVCADIAIKDNQADTTANWKKFQLDNSAKSKSTWKW